MMEISEAEDASELLFFDTFSHEVDSDINLDLVQFPKPVYITQIRIIPLGARVQADFPGGVRLGATNPSTFDIEFFVNDLGIQNAPTFENLGRMKYNQNDCIHLECESNKITDGLVLRGWYSTITLAVYGITRNTLNEPIASPPPQSESDRIVVGVDDICELSADDRNAVLADDDWKEPLPNELAVHKTRVSDYERDDLDYVDQGRDHYMHHSGDERERERRMRKSSPRHRTLSESNEREFLRSRSDRERDRDKSGREWSRSPEYSRRSRRKRSERSRSDAEENSHKWPPRTPPASIDSPTRPRSPDNVIMDYIDDDNESEQDMRYKLKARAYMRSRESLVDAIIVQDTQIIDDDETTTPGTPVEQYEPILSDDEILGDDDDSNNAAEQQAAADEFEAELQAAALAAGTAIETFDAYHMPVLKYLGDWNLRYSKDIENLRLIFKKFELQTKCTLTTFMAVTTTVDERENFVFLSEQLINQLNYIAQNYKRRNIVLHQFFKNNDSKHLQTAFNLLNIALDFNAANAQTQPAFKTRHIKVGARLMELLAGVHDFMAYIIDVQHFDVFTVLLKLYKSEYMALSIKLMLLKAVYALLDTKVGLNYFLGPALKGYQLILEILQQTHLTRTKYALQAIIKKLNLYEALNCLHQNCARLFVLAGRTDCEHEHEHEYDFNILEFAIDQILHAIAINSLSYQQPRRFLPVSKKFEIVMDATAQRSFANALQSYFVQESLGESLLLLLSNANDLPISLVLCTLDLLKALLNTSTGIDYLIDDCFETAKMLIAVLLGLNKVPMGQESEKMEDASLKTEIKCEVNNAVENHTISMEIVKNNNDICITENTQANQKIPKSDGGNHQKKIQKYLKNRMHQLGVEMAYKIQTRYHLDAIDYITATMDFDAIQLTSHLHAIYSNTCDDAAGRQHTIEFLGLNNNNLQTFMELIKKEQRFQAQQQQQQQLGNKYKSPVLMYTVDIIDCCVRYNENLNYLLEHGTSILELAKNHEAFEPSVSAVLQEMYVYLKPLEAIHIFAYDDITPLIDVITRSLDYITTFPGDLIMGLRILRHLAIGANTIGIGIGIGIGHKNAAKYTDNTEELKHRFVTLQFYAADGVQILLQILEKLCTYFEQPGLHKPALCSMQGLYCCQIVLPTLEILYRMLSYAIQTRDVEFKDLVAIDHLMKTYFLLYHFPDNCSAASYVQMAKKEIINLLLAYTQPNELDEELLHKSLWTQMIREVLKNIDAPHTLLPGLHVLAELLPLPLPLPLPSGKQLQASHIQRFITERKLWSAHLHPQSTQIARLIETIAPASFPQLSDLLVRVCLQLADLAPNMTLLISKTFSDLLCNEWNSSGGISCNLPTPHLARLLHFFARLTVHASLKSSALSILCGKLWELFQAILSMKEPSAIALKCQLGIHRILESFLDTEISLIAPKSSTAPEINLASALPPKELIPRVAEAVLTNLFNVDVKHEVSAVCVRNLVILTEHDITFYHLASMLKQKSNDFQQWMQRTVESNESSGSYNTNIESLIVLLRSLSQIEENCNFDHTIPPRTLRLSASELSQLIGFHKDENPHILERMRNILPDNSALKRNGLSDDIQKLIAQLESIDDSSSNNTLINSIETMDEDSTLAAISEPQLPQTESIVSQYAARPVFAVYDPFDQAQLTTRYWLEVYNIDDAYTTGDFDAQFERISYDLTELTNSCLPADTNLTMDCKRVLHLCASPQSNRERTPTAPCFRTRRVEVEPSTGRPEKKLYITPVRGGVRGGFSRAPPSRGDLFRSRPPNTSRPPSLHVDDFLALETCGAQPTGPTGYNKIPPILRGSRIRGNRGSRGIVPGVGYRKPKVLRTSSPYDGSSPHYRPTTSSEAHFSSVDLHYASPSAAHFGMRSRGRGRVRSYLR